MTQLILDLSTSFLAIIAGSAVFRHLSKFHRIIFLQVIIYIITDLISVYDWDLSLKFYNGYMLVETILIFWAFMTLISPGFSKYFHLAFFVLFLVVYLIDVATLQGFFNRAAVTEGIVITVLSLYYLQHRFLFSQEEHSRGITICVVGLLVYFACTIPYLSIMMYLQKNNASVNQALFQKIVLVMAHIRYLLISIGFIIHARKLTTKKI